MSIERIKSMKEKAMSLAEQGLNQDVSCMNAEEVGEIIDIVKDLEEACYYCAIVESMEKSKDDEKIEEMMDKYIPGYTRNYRPYMYESDPMYTRAYTGMRGGNRGMGSRRNYTMKSPMHEVNYMPRTYMDDYMHDEYDGDAWKMRRNYMEGKNDSSIDSSKDLEEYMKSLTSDIMEMIEGATSQEKSMLKQKIATLATKIS